MKHGVLQSLAEKVESYKVVAFELGKLDRQVSLNLVSLDCSALNDALIQRLEKLMGIIVDGEVKKNQELNAL